VTHDAAQWALGALPPRRLMDRDSRCTIGHNSPRIDEDIDEHMGTPCPVEAGPRGVINKFKAKRGSSVGLLLSIPTDS